jgi:uncharacterized membrane protein (UPF0127 family)
MKRRLVLAALATLPAAALAQETDPTGPQPALPKEKLVITGKDGTSHTFDVEMALTPDQQTVGEMFRTEIPADGGMLFDWGFAHESQMWMKNTLVPLDMIFIANDGTITHIAEDAVPESLAEIGSGGPARATLEVQGGLTAKLDIRVGDKVQGAIFK